jgi:hypothetical protein
MDQPLADRRHDRRFGQPAIAGTEAILRPGYAVSLVDLSAGGALIEGPRPLRPGTHVHLQLVTSGRRLGLGARVLRCAVASLDRGIQYRGALKFDHRCTELWEGSTLDAYVLPVEDRVISTAGAPDVPGIDAPDTLQPAIDGRGQDLPVTPSDPDASRGK